MTKRELKQIIKEELLKRNKLHEINKNEIKSIDVAINKLYSKLVPQSGKADTIEGEMLRAISRIIYRYYNDGDYFFKGYGKITAGPSVQWLIKKSPIGSRLSPIFKKAKSDRSKENEEYTENDKYNTYIYEAALMILNYVKSSNGKYTPNPDSDSR